MADKIIIEKDDYIVKTRKDENTPLTIKMDFREDASQIEKILSCKYGVNVLKARLPVGDYIIDRGIVVERKTTLDFVLSIIDGRLFKQAARMRRFFNEVFLIIEGKDLYNLSVDIHPHAIKGALISISVSWQIPILFSNDIEKVITANEEELTKVSGLGKKKAKMIREIVEG